MQYCDQAFLEPIRLQVYLLNNSILDLMTLIESCYLTPEKEKQAMISLQGMAEKVASIPNGRNFND